LHEFNATNVPYDLTRPVQCLFERRVSETPDAVALVVGDEQCSYAQLETRANRLAYRLLALGVKPDDRIALCLDRSVELVVSILAVLKAGAAYVPLDPAYPAERLAFMLADSAPAALLTNARIATALPAAPDGCVVLHADAPAAETLGVLPPAIEAGPQHLAYVIYTSGSTGVPKGVAMSRGALSNLLAWQRATGLDAPGASCTLQFSALGFDVACQEILSTLGSGDALVLVDEAERQDPLALLQQVRRHGVQRLFLPFVALQALADVASRSSDALPLRHVVTAGEQLRVTPALRALFRRLPQARLHNHYGPTETHVVTHLTLDADPDAWETLPTIGRPIDGAAIHLLDRHGGLVPVGAVGEIHVGGVALARGYLHRDDLTAERFVDDPFTDAQPRARLYRTGDLGCWRDDGTIEFLGRRDFQLKVRGFRVEPGEVEAALAACDGVQDAAVAARHDASGQARLVAYVVPRPGIELAPAALRASLAARLPEHMIPTAWSLLAALPLSPNGKLDRRALPDPQAPDRGESACVPPRGAIETFIADTWAELLHLPQVGRHDHFFELGGHSLLAVQMSVRLRDAFGIDMPLRLMFEHPELDRLAEAVSTLQLGRLTPDDLLALEGELDAMSDDELLSALAEGERA